MVTHASSPSTQEAEGEGGHHGYKMRSSQKPPWQGPKAKRNSQVGVGSQPEGDRGLLTPRERLARHEDRARSEVPKGEKQVEVGLGWSHRLRWGDLEGAGTAPMQRGAGVMMEQGPV